MQCERARDHQICSSLACSHWQYILSPYTNKKNGIIPRISVCSIIPWKLPWYNTKKIIPQQTKPPQVTVKTPPMCSFAISEPVTTNKTTYVSCQSKSPKNHRQNFLSRLSVLITVKPPILFMKNFGSVVFQFLSPQNHRQYLVENLGLGFSLELSRRPFCDFERYKNIFLFQCNMLP